MRAFNLAFEGRTNQLQTQMQEAKQANRRTDEQVCACKFRLVNRPAVHPCSCASFRAEEIVRTMNVTCFMLSLTDVTA